MVIAFRCLVIGLLGLITPAQAQAPATGATSSHLIPERLRCEYRVNPLGVDLLSPRLDWILSTNDPAARGLRQTAYEILVASSPDLLTHDQGDLWDSGKVASGALSQIPYAGKALSADQSCWWKVRVWDQTGSPSAWSSLSQWKMGPMAAADWLGARWIGPPDANAKPDLSGPKSTYETVLLRREFAVKPGLKRALVHVCGLGQYEMTLNGSKVGDELLTPGWTQYQKTCLYDTYDITAALRPGANVVGIFLGNGMYLSHQGRYHGNATKEYWVAPLQGIAELHLEYASGSMENVVTDEQWRCHSGPITFSSPYGGEDYDARLDPPDWNKPGFNDPAWDKPQVLNGPGGTLRGISCAAPPIRAFESLAPVSRKEIKPGVTVYDLGQNAAIIPRITVSGPAGSSVRIIPSELVKRDGSADDSIFEHHSVWWQYTLKGSGDETYFSKFFYVGARYLQVELIPAPGTFDLPRLEYIEGNVVHADSPAVGQFSCSNELFNKIYSLVRWAQQNNMVSTMTDCPTREKRGWLEQDHLNGPALRYNWDMTALYTKIASDMKDAQTPDGLVPTTCPDYVPEWLHTQPKYADSPEWSSACILIPWQQYEFEGDTALLAHSYDMMTKYQAYLGSKAKDNIVDYGLGDWVDLGPKRPGESQLTPLALTGTAFYFEDTSLLAKIATILGKDDDAARYGPQANAIRAAFKQHLFHPDLNQYGEGDRMNSQCGNSIPLVMGIADTSTDASVLKSIVADVQAKGLTAGDVGYRYLLRALADGGRSDVIYALNNQSEKPGYGLQIKLGKTSLAECWNGSASQDHFMLGQINEWFFHDLAGIQYDPDGPGFRKIIIKPAIVGNLEWVKASYDSISGKIVSEWKRDGQTVTLHVVIPVNTTATFCVPARDPRSVRESNLSAAVSPGVKFLKMNGPVAMYEIGSGTYDFRSTLPKADSP